MKYRIVNLLVIFLILATVFSGVLNGCNEPKNRKTIIKTDDVILLSLFTFDGKKESSMGLKNLGHSFLSLENISKDDIKIGEKIVKAGETISLGTWSIKAHFGVWYNVESNYIKDYNKYDGRISITTGISLDDVTKITSFVSKNDSWSPLHNCSYFALNLWNEVVESSEKINTPIIYTPTKVVNRIKCFENYQYNKEIITENSFCYYDNSTPVIHNLEGKYVAV